MKFKKMTAAALAAIMAIGSLQVVAFADSATTEQQNKKREVNLDYGETFILDNVKYTYHDSSLLYLDVCGLADDSGLTEITIPSEIDGIEVNGIADEAFKNCSNLKSVTIPCNVMCGDSAFEGCTSLTTVNFLDYTGDYSGRFVISDSAFKNCTNLTSVNIGMGITAIGPGAFDGCSALVSIDLPQSIDTIYPGALCGCTSLSTITIPNAVKRIYSSTFENCSSLSKINIGSGVTEIYLCGGSCGYASDEYYTNGCFEGCVNLAEINVDPKNKIFSSEDGVLFMNEGDGLQLCKFPPMKSGAYVVPDEVSSISGSGSLLGGGYNHHNPFENCRFVTSITIPASVEGIATDFSDCTSLKEINVNSDNKRYFSDNGVLYTGGKSGLSLMVYPIAKPDKSYTISEDTFLIQAPLSPNLTSITINSYYIGYINSESFGNNSNITDIYFIGNRGQWLNIRTYDVDGDGNRDVFDSVLGDNITVHYLYNSNAPTTSEPTASKPAPDPTESTVIPGGTDPAAKPGGSDKPANQDIIEVTLKNVDSENGIEGEALDKLLFGDSGLTWEQVEKIEFSSDDLFSVQFSTDNGGWRKLGEEAAARADDENIWNTEWTLNTSEMAKDKKFAKVIAKDGIIDVTAKVYIKSNAEKPSGDSSGADQQPTGIALAIAPVVLAASAAIVVFKKKK